MFKTNDAFEMVVPPGLAPPELRLWYVVSFTFTMPWFYIQCELGYDEDIRTEHYMVFGAREFEHFLAGADSSQEHFRVCEVYVVSPPWLNGRGRWSMDILSELWIVDESYESRHAVVFVLEDGTRLIHADDVIEESQLGVKRPAYQRPRLH